MKVMKIIKNVDKKEKLNIKLALSKGELINKLRRAKVDDIIIFDERFGDIE